MTDILNDEFMNEAASISEATVVIASAAAPVEEAKRLIEAVETASAIPAGKAATLRSVLLGVRASIDNALRLLDAAAGTATTAEASDLVQPESHIPSGAPMSLTSVSFPGDRVVEGVFDGEQMIGADGKSYAVPPNYASKSKLVEGDLLKLTIGPRGNFIYKQVGPIERQRLVGALAYDQESGHFMVLSGGRSWRVLKASVTYFHGEVADEGVILVPKNAPSRWAAVENVIKRNGIPANESSREQAFGL